MNLINPLCDFHMLVTAAAVCALAPSALATNEAICWPDEGGSKVIVPANLGPITDVSSGAEHSLAIQIDGKVVCWGQNSAGQCNTPFDLGPCKAIAGGYHHTAALRQDGVVRCWGVNIYGQCNVPSGLVECVDVVAGYRHTAAIGVNGIVYAWGGNIEGQTDVPTDLGFCKQLASGSYHMVSLDTAGTVRAWGSGENGQSSVPASLGPCISVGCGHAHSLAVRIDGSVDCWGANTYMQSTVPANLGVCIQVAGGHDGSVALLESGYVVTWGNESPTFYVPPEDIGYVRKITAGWYHFTAMRDLDCDGNLVPDTVELAAHDCNGNGMIDACDAIAGILEDCNGNGLGDECEKQLQISLGSTQLGPIGQGFPQAWTIADAVMAVSPVTIKVRGLGDFGAPSEFVRVRIGSGFDEQALATAGDCIQPPVAQTFTMSAEEFNGSIATDGSILVQLDPSIAVNHAQCPGGSWVEVTVAYVGAASSDCNANGMLDDCELAAGLAADVNRNGVVDTCEVIAPACPADLNSSGDVDGGDLGILLAAWGASAPNPADLNGDDLVDGGDLGVLLAAWGTCAQ